MDKKVILITGISSGFGKEISKQLVDYGHTVYGTIRTECEIAEGVKPIFLELTNIDSIKKAITMVDQAEGKIDVLINNAGMHSGGPIEETPIEVAKKQLDVSLFGWINVINEALPLLRNSSNANIINISSIGGIMGLPFQGIYSTAKFAIEGFSEALRLELKQFGIRVTVVNPGDFKTNCTASRVYSLKENSIYTTQFNKTKAVVEQEEQNGKDPKLLAKTICKIVHNKRPKPRYLVGDPFQKLAVYLKQLLPERLFIWAFSKYYKIG